MSVTRDQLIDFIYDEVRMLDEGRYDEWLSLWLPDGIYWMPLDYKQTDPINQTSLLYEDMFMLKLRVERLNGARTFSQKPKSRCHHVIQRPFVDEMGEDRFVTNTSMHYVETRLDEQQLLALTVRHDLALVDGALRIAGKRVHHVLVFSSLVRTSFKSNYEVVNRMSMICSSSLPITGLVLESCWSKLPRLRVTPASSASFSA